MIEYEHISPEDPERDFESHIFKEPVNGDWGKSKIESIQYTREPLTRHHTSEELAITVKGNAPRDLEAIQRQIEAAGFATKSIKIRDWDSHSCITLKNTGLSDLPKLVGALSCDVGNDRGAPFYATLDQKAALAIVDTMAAKIPALALADIATEHMDADRVRDYGLQSAARYIGADFSACPVGAVLSAQESGQWSETAGVPVMDIATRLHLNHNNRTSAQVQSALEKSGLRVEKYGSGLNVQADLGIIMDVLAARKIVPEFFAKSVQQNTPENDDTSANILCFSQAAAPAATAHSATKNAALDTDKNHHIDANLPRGDPA